MHSLKFKLTIIILFSIVVLIACSRLQPVVNNGMKIGAVIPLTGSFSWLGQDQHDALLLALADYNRLPNMEPVRLIIEDSQGDPKQAVLAVHKLLEQDKVDGLITSLSSIGQAIKPITEQHQISHFIISIHPDITSDSQFTFRVYPSVQQEAQLMIRYLNQENYSNVAILNIKTPESELLANKYLKKYFDKPSINLVASENFSFQDSDINTQLLRIKASQPEILIISAFSNQHDLIFKSLTESGMQDLPILGDINFSFSKPEKITSKEVIFVAPDFISFKDEYADFKEHYQFKYQIQPNYDPAFMYDNFMILASALVEAQQKKQNIVDVIKNFKTYRGVSGQIEILENHGSDVAMSLFKIENKRLLLLNQSGDEN